MSEDFEHLRQWVGRKEVRQDVASAWPLTALAATLDDTAVSTDAGAPIPPGWHWIFFLDVKPPAELGPDGHPKRGGFLPPVPLPRRMWAGGSSSSCARSRWATQYARIRNPKRRAQAGRRARSFS